MLDGPERDYLEAARLGRLATANAAGRPHVVPVCFAVVEDELVTPVDEKPQTVSPTELRRIRDLRENPRVALVVDHYAEDWAELGWVQIRGTAAVVEPREEDHAEDHSADDTRGHSADDTRGHSADDTRDHSTGHSTGPSTRHSAAVTALRAKYDQYATHALEERPVVVLTPGSVRSWGRLARPDESD